MLYHHGFFLIVSFDKYLPTVVNTFKIDINIELFTHAFHIFIASVLFLRSED